MGESIEKQIERLREEIRRHDRLYYVMAQPEISDREYDRLYAQLKELEDAHPELVTADSPTQRVAGQPLTEFATVKHSRPMLSMDNTYNAEELRAFDKRVAKTLNGQKYEYAVESKIDGIAVALRYEGGMLTLGATRGDGTQGDDITTNLRTIASIPLKLNAIKGQGKKKDSLFDDGDDVPDLLEVRGEVFMDHGQFGRINEQREDEGQPLFANPRNATAGSLKLLDSSLVAKRGLRFYAYAVGESTEVLAETHSENLERLKAMGMAVNPSCRTAADIEKVITICQEWEKERRHEAEYPIDGMVIKVNSLAQQRVLGQTARAPKWCIAYKFAAEQAESRITSIDIQVGKTGALTPVANLEPVALAGTTVSRASLHNFDEVARKDVRVGDTVVVEKAGEIIPQVVSVNLDKRPKGSKPLAVPKDCPVCGGSVAKDEDGVYVRCVNPNCAGQLVERIKHFAGRGQMDIEGLGSALVEQLVKEGLVKSFADLYRLDAETVAGLERMGAKSAENLIKGIEASKAQPLARVLAGLGILHVGKNVAEILAERFGAMDGLLEAEVEQLEGIDEIGPQIARSVYDFCHGDEGRGLVEELMAAGLRMPGPEKADVEQTLAGQTLAGQTIVVTGTVEGYSREDMQDLIKQRGGKCSSSVSKKTSLVVYGENPGSKVEKAEKLGVKVMPAAEFLAGL
ncbi:MAG: NAD-dependent DNA ligase LigA [Sedimentisphaerales bacterium]|nr:NAD-dependent DNA ligase LigA [Sedimentisphaerales bacterium]